VWCCVADDYDLAAGADDGFVLDAAEFGGLETCAVYYDVGFLAGGVQGGGVVNVSEDRSRDGAAVAEALGDEVGEVDGGVDADGCEGCC
jgi:hypothetical protein